MYPIACSVNSPPLPWGEGWGEEMTAIPADSTRAGAVRWYVICRYPLLFLLLLLLLPFADAALIGNAYAAQNSRPSQTRPEGKPSHSTVAANTLHLAYAGGYGKNGAGAQDTVAWSFHKPHKPVATEQVRKPAGQAERKAGIKAAIKAETEHAEQPQWLTQPAPIGSLWKLLMHIYLVGRERSVPAYVCTGRSADRQAEQYCCDAAGERVDRVAALAHSCGAYFQPQRVGVAQGDWQRFWRGIVSGGNGGQHEWLTGSIPSADTQASPQQIIAVLAAVPPALRQRASEGLLAAHVTVRSTTALPVWGGAWRIKTFTWQAQDGVYTGGGAGWLADGAVVWFAGRGSSSAVIGQWAAELHGQAYTRRVAQYRATDLQQLLQQSGDCVRVRHFAAYPLQSVQRDGAAQSKKKHAVNKNAAENHAVYATEKTAQSSLAAGFYTAHFANGNRLRFRGTTQQWLETTAGKPSQPEKTQSQKTQSNRPPQLWGEYSMTDYVARVIDREGNARQPAAAQALGILARSYVQQFARRTDNCYLIDDSSAHQRVSASPPSPAAVRAALWSASLVTDGAVPQYRLRSTASGRTPEGLPFMAWETAVQQAKQGRTALEILRQSWPNLAIAGLHGGTSCHPQPNLQRWLQQQTFGWHRILRTQAGYERPGQVQVCTLTLGNPYADMQRNRIYIQQHSHTVLPQHIRMGLLHEYLHLAFRHHPRGRDEDFIEGTARRLHRTAWRGGVP